MPSSDEERTLDSPTGNVARHIRDYVSSDGEIGHVHRGRPTLLLSTRGRRSGTLRRTALIYGRDNAADRDNAAGPVTEPGYVLVASNAGSAGHPAWYLNLVQDPVVRVQVGAERFVARARTATAEERAELWPGMVGIFHMFDVYQRKAKGREIPLVIVERP